MKIILFYFSLFIVVVKFITKQKKQKQGNNRERKKKEGEKKRRKYFWGWSNSWFFLLFFNLFVWCFVFLTDTNAQKQETNMFRSERSCSCGKNLCVRVLLRKQKASKEKKFSIEKNEGTDVMKFQLKNKKFRELEIELSLIGRLIIYLFIFPSSSNTNTICFHKRRKRGHSVVCLCVTEK